MGGSWGHLSSFGPKHLMWNAAAAAVHSHATVKVSYPLKPLHFRFPTSPSCDNHPQFRPNPKGSKTVAKLTFR